MAEKATSERGSPFVVLCGGGPPGRRLRSALPPDALVVAADSGYETALALGLRVDILVGDLDSIGDDALAHARAHGVPIDEFPTDKDATDLELGLDLAVARGATRLVVVGGQGGRLDHLAGTLTLLAAHAYAHLPVEAWLGTAHVLVAHGPGEVAVAGGAGETVTLLPLGGPADGVRTVGLRYPLDRESLAPGTTRGVSNVLTAAPASVSLDAGTLLVIRPDALDYP